MLIAILVCLIAWLCQLRLGRLRFGSQLHKSGVPRPRMRRHVPVGAIRSQRKPDWVRSELIRIKAYSPKLGSRVIAEVFNRRFAIERRVTVSKSHVADVLRRYRSEVAWLRRTIRHRVPKPTRRNTTWGMDLTTVTDDAGLQRLVLGIVDHGTRASILLRELADKRSLTILREVIAAIRQFGCPKRIRVDNDACFTSKLMRTSLLLLGIRLQTTEVHCPWQNGRVERFFGTFKHAIRSIVVQGDDLQHRLIEFRAFYNHARTHQHLDGQTPAEAWNGVSKAHGPGEFIDLWPGALSGWYSPMKE